MGENIFALQGLFVVLLIALEIASVAILILHAIGKEKQMELLNKLIYVPAATFVIFIVGSISRFMTSEPNGDPVGTATSGKYGHWDYTPSWGFFIAIILILIVVVISVLVALGKVRDEEPNAVAPATPVAAIPVAKEVVQPSNIDQIKQLKELLDEGLITQEDFDTKKKQLLGL